MQSTPPPCQNRAPTHREVAIRSICLRTVLVLALAPGLAGCGVLIAVAVAAGGYYLTQALTGSKKKLFVVRNPDPAVPVVRLAFRTGPEEGAYESDAFVRPGGRAEHVAIDWESPDGYYQVAVVWADGRMVVLDHVLVESNGPPVPLDLPSPDGR